jgi:hypothetical protein
MGDVAHAELFRGVLEAGIGLAVIGDRKARWDASAIPGDRPIVLLLGDDDYSSTGPLGWRAARGSLSWARAVFIHGAGADPEHYRGAVGGAILHRRLLLVETDAAHIAAWTKAAGSKPKLTIVPQSGVHPTPSRPAVLQ